jgi:uncharacterized protein (TIGR00369 family)
VEPAPAFIHEPSVDQPGWHVWELDDPCRFNGVAFGRMLLRAEGERRARLRLPEVQARHTNLHGKVHGGLTMSLIDVGMFATMYTVIGPQVSGSVTLDLNCQFIGSGLPGEPLDCVSDVMKETGRLVFLRGTVEQAHGLVASFLGTLRKPSHR